MKSKIGSKRFMSLIKKKIMMKENKKKGVEKKYFNRNLKKRKSIIKRSKNQI